MEEERVVARVRIKFHDGREEEIGVSLDQEQAPTGLSYRAWVYPPDGAVVLGLTADRQFTRDGIEIKVDHLDVPEKPLN